MCHEGGRVLRQGCIWEGCAAAQRLLLLLLLLLQMLTAQRQGQQGGERSCHPTHHASLLSSDPSSTWSPVGCTARHVMVPLPPISFLDRAFGGVWAWDGDGNGSRRCGQGALPGWLGVLASQVAGAGVLRPHTHPASAYSSPAPPPTHPTRPFCCPRVRCTTHKAQHLTEPEPRAAPPPSTHLLG